MFLVFLEHLEGFLQLPFQAPYVFLYQTFLNSKRLDPHQKFLLFCSGLKYEFLVPQPTLDEILKTPNLDSMATNGLRLDRFYAGSPLCSPTRATVLTGRSNDRTGVFSHGYALRLQEKTLAQALKKKGYKTAHFGKWHLNGLKGPGVPILKDDDHSPESFGFDYWVSSTNFFDLNPMLSKMGEFIDFKGRSSEIIVTESIKFIEDIGIKNIMNHEKEILEYGLEKIKKNNSVKIIGEPKNRGSIISFTIKGIHPHDIATILDEDGVAIRAGHHCCQILHEKMGITASARASLGIYNSKEDIDILSNAINKCNKVFNN